MTEIRVLTVPLDPRTGLFDDEALRTYLLNREVLRAEPHFFEFENRPCCAVYLQTRLLQGAPAAVSTPRAGGTVAIDPAREAFLRLLSELDESERVRYERLVAWRRAASGREGLPPYVLMTNQQALELARRAPLSLEGIGQVRGIGRRRIEQHGREILEVLHGPEPARGSERPASVRTVDGRDEVAVRTDGTVSETLAVQPDGTDRDAGGGDPGGRDGGGVPEGPSS